MSKTASITIAGRRIGPDEPVYVIAEMSGNHNQSFEEAVRIIEVLGDQVATPNEARQILGLGAKSESRN